MATHAASIMRSKRNGVINAGGVAPAVVVAAVTITSLSHDLRQHDRFSFKFEGLIERLFVGLRSVVRWNAGKECRRKEKMWPWSRSYDRTPEGTPVVPAGLLEHLIAGAGPHGFSSSSTAEAVAKQHGSSTAGRTVLVVGESMYLKRVGNIITVLRSPMYRKGIAPQLWNSGHLFLSPHGSLEKALHEV